MQWCLALVQEMACTCGDCMVPQAVVRTWEPAQPDTVVCVTVRQA